MISFLRQRRALLLAAFVYPALILAVNLLIVAKEFKVDYSAYLESNEGSFIAIARNIAAHPGDLLWWPYWDLGLPFQNTYIPGLHMVVAAFSRLTGHAAGLAFHQVGALFFAFGPVAVYFMAWIMTRQAGASWFGAMAYSILSPATWLMPAVREDVGGPWNLRRLQIFAYYGEGPYTASLFFVPLAILFLYLALSKGKVWMKLAAAVCLALAVLMNAFAAVMLAIAAVTLIAVMPAGRIFRSAALVALIGVVAYLWISPLLPPSVAADIRANSHREYPFDGASALGLVNLCACCALLWILTKNRASAPLRMFLLFAMALGSIVLQAYYNKCNILPQPLRYGTIMDMAICLSLAFGGAALFQMLPGRARQVLTVLLIGGAVVEARHEVRYGRRLIQRGDIATTTTYHVAQWMNQNLPGERVFVGGAPSFHFNAFADNPQMHGGHDPMQPSILPLIGFFVVASGMNTGDRDMEISTVWLKALGAHAFSVPGPIDDGYYRTFPHPERFEGNFPVLWQESDTTIYGVPTRSRSLAHVVPETSLVRRAPYNGLDIEQMSRYVDAMEDPAIPEADFRWTTRHSATIHATMQPGQVISVQEHYMPGWTATVNGQPRKMGKDGLGFMVIRPDCTDCQVTIDYDGGIQWRATCAVSFLVTLLGIFLLVRPALRRSRSESPASAKLQPVP